MSSTQVGRIIINVQQSATWVGVTSQSRVCSPLPKYKKRTKEQPDERTNEPNRNDREKQESEKGEQKSIDKGRNTRKTEVKDVK